MTGLPYSLRNASTGFMRAARHAGKKPDTTPVKIETAKATPATDRDRVAGRNFPIKNVTGHAIASATTPPSRQMLAASRTDWMSIVLLVAPLGFPPPIAR